MAEEDVCDHVRAVSVDNLVEEIDSVGKRVGAIPAGEDVAKDPYALAFVFGVLKLGDQEGEVAGVVGVG